VYSCLCVVEDLESKAQCFYGKSLLTCLFLLRSLTCSDMVCASASVRTMSEDIKKALSYSHVATFECHQVSPEVICNPFPLYLLSLHRPLPFILPRPLSVPSLIFMPRSTHPSLPLTLPLPLPLPLFFPSKISPSSLCLALHRRWMRRL
jgi:hypothetical protein